MVVKEIRSDQNITSSRLLRFKTFPIIVTDVFRTEPIRNLSCMYFVVIYDIENRFLIIVQSEIHK